MNPNDYEPEPRHVQAGMTGPGGEYIHVLAPIRATAMCVVPATLNWTGLVELEDPRLCPRCVALWRRQYEELMAK